MNAVHRLIAAAIAVRDTEALSEDLESSLDELYAALDQLEDEAARNGKERAGR